MSLTRQKRHQRWPSHQNRFKTAFLKAKLAARPMGIGAKSCSIDSTRSDPHRPSKGKATDDASAIPVGMSRSGKLFAIHSDHLGTPRLLTNEQNTPVWQWPYSAFGNNKPTGILKATTNPKSAMTNSPQLLKATGPAAEFDLRFPGQYADDEAGVFYNYHRNYKPQDGRYTQGDPIGLAGGLNRFGYANGAPTMYTDPLGLFGWADMPSAPQGVVDAVTGFGDAFLIPELSRDALDIDGGVNQCSASYRGGKATGFVVGAVPFGLELGAELGTTKFASILNKNRYFRVGPGKASANARFGLGGGRNVPMARLGNGKPSDWNHIDLRSRLPKVAPLGGPGECGCP